MRARAADGDALAKPLRRLALERDAHAVAQEPVSRHRQRRRQHKQNANGEQKDASEHE